MDNFLILGCGICLIGDVRFFSEYCETPFLVEPVETVTAEGNSLLLIEINYSTPSLPDLQQIGAS
jgi:hypothetical protein